jgi:flagellar basal body rod protein FlgB
MSAKEMSAKTMFENLGYEERKEEYKNDKIFAITYTDYEDGNWIKITKETIEVVRNRTNGYLSVSTLPAINKQIEELHWNE